MEDLKVKIRKIFREELERKFNIENVKYDSIFERYEINVRCTFCLVYDCMGFGSNVCPFVRFKTESRKDRGCVNWMLKVTGFEKLPIKLGWLSLYWYKRDNKQARRFLVLLRKQARKYIEFVD
jgi:hypothetical protein